MTSAPPPHAGSSDLTEALIALSPEADWHRSGDELRCTLDHGTAVVRPAPNGGWDVERELDGRVVDRRTLHEGLDGTAAEQVADVVLGWGG